MPRGRVAGGLRERTRTPKADAVYHIGKNVVTRAVRPFAVADDDYRKILERADLHFSSVTRSQPQNLQCGAGCSLCCYGLFEIGSGDVPLIADGLAAMHPMRRKKVIRRALDVVDRYAHPNLRECSGIEKEEFFDRTQSTACPNLDDSGRCMMYEHRPLVCRTFGVPIREGADYIGDICDLNFRESTQQEREAAAWDLEWEDVLGSEDEYTIPEAIVLVARMRGWL